MGAVVQQHGGAGGARAAASSVFWSHWWIKMKTATGMGVMGVAVGEKNYLSIAPCGIFTLPFERTTNQTQ